MDTDNYEIPEFPASKTIQKQQKYVLSMPGWLQPSSNGKQDLKFITQEHSVQQQGKCWCRPNIFSAYCKFYLRVITLAIISLTVPGSNMKQILHSDWLIKWLSRAFCSLFLFLWTSTSSPAKKCKKEYDQYPAIMTSHHIYLLKERNCKCSLFFFNNVSLEV